MAHSYEEETVRLRLDGEIVPIAISYKVAMGIFQVPCAFSMTVGHAGIFAELASRFPPGTPFSLELGGKVIASGETDGFATSGETTVMNIKGRDWMSRLHDTELTEDQTFSEKTYRAIVELALKEVGLSDRLLFSSDTANRKAITGTTTVARETNTKTEEQVTEGGQADGDGQSRTIYRVVKAEVGNSWLEFITSQNKKAGLFLWATFDGDFVLSRPNGNQAPIYRILLKPNDVVSVVGRDFSHDTTQRYTEFRVFGRGGGGKKGRARAMASVFDEEMIAILNPDPADRVDGGKRQKVHCIKDSKVRSKEHAEHLARRMMAESRRNSWKLSYTVAGHTTPGMNGNGRLVWQPNTVVEVVDDQLGIQGPMYVESIDFERGPAPTGTTTKLTLLRIEDMVFEEELDSVKASKPRLVEKPGVAAPVLEGFTLLFPWDKGPNRDGAKKIGGGVFTQGGGGVAERSLANGGVPSDRKKT